MVSNQDKIRQIKEMINSYKISHLIMTANDLGIFNVINTEPILIKNIADKLDLNVSKVEPLLNSLVFHNVLSKNNKGYYLEYFKEVLHPDSELNQLEYIKFAKVTMNKWNTLDAAIKDTNLSIDNFNELTTKNASDFSGGMNTNAISQSKFIIENYNFDNHKILDIGAGAGTYIIKAVEQYENVKGIALDLPEIAKLLKKNVNNKQLTQQIEVIAGDFNDRLPDGEYDDIFLFAVIHMENDENVQRLLRKIYKSLKLGGRLFLTSFFLEEDKISPEFSVMFAVQMLMLSKNGKVYTHNEITNYIKNAGFFKVSRIDDIPGYATLYIAEK